MQHNYFKVCEPVANSPYSFLPNLIFGSLAMTARTHDLESLQFSDHFNILDKNATLRIHLIPVVQSAPKPVRTWTKIARVFSLSVGPIEKDSAIIVDTEQTISGTRAPGSELDLALSLYVLDWHKIEDKEFRRLLKDE
ncbi:MAG: hypothetical protein IPK01_00700 [Acidobacteria bacterium]|nr:hypothetical protein [Acidobacteriota bacterium]